MDYMQKYRIFLKRVAEKGALTAKGSMSDKVFRSSFAPGHSSLHVLKDAVKEQQQMRITSPIFQQGFRPNPNSSNLGLFRLPNQLHQSSTTVPDHGLFGHSYLLGKQATVNQHPILGFGINSNINNQHHTQARPGISITPSLSSNYSTSQANLVGNSSYPSNNFAGIERNSNGGGLVGYLDDQAGLNINSGGVTGGLLLNNGYDQLGNGVCSDNMNISVGSLGNDSGLGYLQAQGGSSSGSGGFESGIQALLFPNNHHYSGFSSNNVNNGKSNVGYKDGLITFNNIPTASHAQQSSVENNISNLILMGDTANIQPSFYHQVYIYTE